MGPDDELARTTRHAAPAAVVLYQSFLRGDSTQGFPENIDRSADVLINHQA